MPLPDLSGASGYSQSRSTPSKLYVDIKLSNDLIKALCASGDAAMSEKVVAVGPGSLNVQPPIAMKTLSEAW